MKQNAQSQPERTSNTKLDLLKKVDSDRELFGNVEDMNFPHSYSKIQPFLCWEFTHIVLNIQMSLSLSNTTPSLGHSTINKPVTI